MPPIASENETRPAERAELGAASSGMEGQNFQQQAGGYGNTRQERPSQGGRPGPSYWTREAEGTARGEGESINRHGAHIEAQIKQEL